MNSYSRTNQKTQLAAMRYLAEKKPERFKFIKKMFSADGDNLAYYLFEKRIDKKQKEFLNEVHVIEIKPNF